MANYMAKKYFKNIIGKLLRKKVIPVVGVLFLSTLVMHAPALRAASFDMEVFIGLANDPSQSATLNIFAASLADGTLNRFTTAPVVAGSTIPVSAVSEIGPAVGFADLLKPGDQLSVTSESPGTVSDPSNTAQATSTYDPTGAVTTCSTSASATDSGSTAAASCVDPFTGLPAEQDLIASILSFEIISLGPDDFGMGSYFGLDITNDEVLFKFVVSFTGEFDSADDLTIEVANSFGLDNAQIANDFRDALTVVPNMATLANPFEFINERIDTTDRVFSIGVQGAARQVPEPEIGMLLTLGLFAIGLQASRRKRKHELA